MKVVKAIAALVALAAVGGGAFAYIKKRRK